MNLRFFVVILSTIFSCMVFGANAYDNDSIVKEIEETLRAQCKHQVKALNVHMGHIARKEYPDSLKDYHIESCLDLFMGDGKKNTTFSLFNNDSLIIPTPIVKVVNLTDSFTICYSVYDYLKNLKHGHTAQNFHSAECYVRQFEDNQCVLYLKYRINKMEEECEIILVETKCHSVFQLNNVNYFYVELGDIIFTEEY